MKPSNEGPGLTGNWTMIGLWPKVSFISAMVFSQSAFSESSWLTATMRGSLYLSA